LAELISIVVTTYDRVDALDAVLRSLSRQTDRDFEVVIADDGSGPETAARIGGWKAKLGVPLKQVWHEHRDFRAGEIRNRGIRASEGRYCIFLDGDCIARPDFVARHRALAESGWFVTGNRVLLTDRLTAKVLGENLEPEQWGMGDWIGQRFSGGLNRLAPVANLPLGPLRRMNAGAWEGARSCNLAI
jgi:glycosyltransferase involved in cell wall biosynthesis